MTDGTEWIVHDEWGRAHGRTNFGAVDGIGEWLDLPEFNARARVSEEYLLIEDHFIPCTLEMEDTEDVGGPRRYFRVEIQEGGLPKLAELRLLDADPDSQGVRQADLREIEVAALVETFVAIFTMHIKRDDDGRPTVLSTSYGRGSMPEHVRFLGQKRMGRTTRDITPQLLERVAELYRNNIDRYPTKAVQHHFQVSQRTAAEYVSRARKRGLLPPTKKGKKQA